MAMDVQYVVAEYVYPLLSSAKADVVKVVSWYDALDFLQLV